MARARPKNERLKLFRDYDELEILRLVRAEIDRIGIADNPTQALYQKNREPSLAPSVSWIRAVYGYSWHDVLEKLGLKLQSRVDWSQFTSDVVQQVVKEFIWDHKVTSFVDYKVKSRNQTVPSYTIVSRILGVSFIIRTIEELIIENGVYSGITKRSWQFYDDDQLLEFAHTEIKKRGIVSVADYLQKADRRFAPTLTTLKRRFGTRLIMDVRYQQLFQEQMFPSPRKQKE